MNRLLLPALAVATILLAALAAPLLPLPNPVQMDVAHRLSAPTTTHLLGQDEYGRDVLSRLLWGARVSLTVALASAAIACTAGTILGVLGGYLRGITELLTLRLVDVVLCFPPLLLALLVVTLLGPGAATLILVLSVLYTPGFARIAYAGVLATRAQDYVEAVRVLGASGPRIMLRTIVPNILGPILVQISLTAAAAIVLESGLSFLGLGVVPPAPSWGLMIRGGRSAMDQAPLLLLWPCLALTLTILAINALCDAIQTTLDPRHSAKPRRILGRILPGLLPTPRPPGPAPSGTAPFGTPVLDLRNLTIEIATPAGPIRPVRDVSFHVHAGETLAIVGESGSGKSLTGLAILGLLPQAARPIAGEAWVKGENILAASPSALRRLRGGVAAMVFQDSLSSMNPVHRVGDQIAEAIQTPGARTQAIALLARVGIPDPAARARSFPHEMSGGMRQRAMIAMALARNPALLIADEPTTALDVTIQAQVLDLLAGLQQERGLPNREGGLANREGGLANREGGLANREVGLAIVFITHSLPVVAEIASRVVVMYAGQVMEEGPVAEVFTTPRHPYTSALLASAPHDDGSLPTGIPGVVPLPHALPPGCTFAPRCPHCAPLCNTPPPLQHEGPRATRCIRWKELA